MKGFWSRTKARLSKKLGPLPAWVWLAASLLLVVLYIRHKNAAAATTPAATTDATAAAATPADLATYTDTGGGGSGDTTPATPQNPLSTPASWDPGNPAASPPPQQPPASPGSSSSPQGTARQQGEIAKGQSLLAAAPRPGSAGTAQQQAQIAAGRAALAASKAPVQHPAAAGRPPVIVVPTNTLGGHTIARAVSKGPRSKVGV